MIVLLAFMFISIIAFIAMAFYSRKYNIAIAVTVYFIGLTVMIISNIMYQVRIGSLTHAWMQNNRPFYDFLMHIRFSFSFVQRMSLFGEILILFSLALLTNITLIKKAKWYVLYGLLLICYYVINDPEILYMFYLAINSLNAHERMIAKNIYHALYGCKIFIVGLFFIFPFFVCIRKYFAHTFSIIRRNILAFAVAVVTLELLLLILINTEYIHSFFTLNPTIFYNSSSTAIITERAITVMISIFVLIVFVLMIKSSFFNKNYFDMKWFSVYEGSKKLDRTLRMILHTYKNMFLAINQLSKAAVTSSAINEQKENRSNLFVSSIFEISRDALYNITHLLNMLSNVEITAQTLDIKEIIDIAIAKENIDNRHIKLTINCPKNRYFVNSDNLYMTDLIYNVYKNACDAVGSSENPEISINVCAEEDWLLIEIKDNGCGIPKALKNQIFKPLISNKQGTNNWGIGLYYAKKIVKAHNGYIFVESCPGKYTKFEIYLPVSKTIV